MPSHVLSLIRHVAAQIMFEILDTKLTNVHVFNPGEELHKWLSMPHQQTCPEVCFVSSGCYPLEL